MVKFTPEQQQAIDQRNCNLLVSAAAGSGKTAVLVERIINLIKDNENPVDVDRLLVVTFTEAAAYEMKQRITLALSKALENDPFNEHLRKQINLLNKASISTIHSFCNSVIRKYFHIISVDPSYKIGDTAEISIMQEEILNDIFLEEYEKENNEIFYELIEIFSDKFTDEKLKSLIHRIYEFSNNSLYPEKWLDSCAEEFNIREKNIDSIKWIEIIKESVKRRLYALHEEALMALEICNKPNGPLKYADAIHSDIELIKALIKASDSFESLYEGFSNISFASLQTIRASDTIDEDLKQAFKDIRDNYIKKEISKIKEKFFFKPPYGQIKDISTLYPYVLKLIEIIKEFRKRYALNKLEKNILDFNDLEHFCLKILSTSEEASKEYRDKFEEVFTDEYQDSNDIQEAILSLVSRENNRFMVGDLKQSIYKFRRAKPEIFKEKYYAYSISNHNKKIDLSTNFRSRKGILDASNFLFKQLMSLEIGDVRYDVNEWLNYGASYPEANEAVEILLCDTKNEPADDEIIDNINKVEYEAKAIGSRILKMIKGENDTKIWDREGERFRNPDFKDIVILTRSLSDADTLIDELSKMGIPAYADNSGGYFENIEVLTIISLLSIIDNPRQDIHLAAILHSPIYSVNSDELCQIRMASPDGYYYDGILSLLSEENSSLPKNTYDKLKKFTDDLEYFRKESKYRPVSKFIGMLYRHTNYFNYVGAMPGGTIRQANLRALEQYAFRFENTSLKGLFSFIKYIEKIIKRDTQVGSANALSENENVVRIMTIHKSKGLEFPIVFLAFCGKKFNLRDEYQDIVLHDHLGLGPGYVDLEMRIKSNTIAKCALAEKIHEENYSEELRILYVALTRAKEKLIITGSISGAEGQIKKWSKLSQIDNAKIPHQYILSAVNYLDMIMYAVLRHKDGFNKIKEVYNIDNPLNLELFNDLSKWEIEIVNYQIDIDKLIREDFHHDCEDNDYLIDKNVYASLEECFNWVYQYDNTLSLPSKLSISEIKRNYYSRKKFEIGEESSDFSYPVFRDPDFIKQGEPLSSLDKGTAIHTLMEHFDLKVFYNKEDIKNLIYNLTAKNIFSEEEANGISIEKIYRFMNSSLSERIRKAKFIKKEMPFVMDISSEEAYLMGHGEGCLLVHGIIDLFFEEEDGLVLVDYKSDYISKNNINIIKERYQVQLSIYKKALERSMNMKVKEVYIYLFSIDDFLEMTSVLN